MQTFAQSAQQASQLRFDSFSPFTRSFSQISESQKAFVYKMSRGEKEIRADSLNELRQAARTLLASP
jgi:hypothetical protein